MKKIKKKIISTVVGLMSFMPSASLANRSGETEQEAPQQHELNANPKTLDDMEKEIYKKINWEKLAESGQYYRDEKNVLVTRRGFNAEYEEGKWTLQNIQIPVEKAHLFPKYQEARSEGGKQRREQTAMTKNDLIALLALGGTPILGLTTGLTGLCVTEARKNWKETNLKCMETIHKLKKES